MQGLRLDYFYLVAVDQFVSYLKQNNRINHNVDTAIQSQLLQPSLFHYRTGLCARFDPILLAQTLISVYSVFALNFNRIIQLNRSINLKSLFSTFNTLPQYLCHNPAP